MATKLHELLAVKENVDNQAKQMRTDLTATFEKKRHLFEETQKNFTPLEENAKTVREEQKDIQTSVYKEIGWISKILAKAMDVNYQIDLANTLAKADVLVDGEALLKDVPATNLLLLSKRMAEIKVLVDAIPTLDPAKGFRPDPDKGKGIYRAREVSKSRTKKVNKVVTLAPATDKHPAQVQLVPEDVAIGTIQELEWSAMITPALKSDILERLEELTRAVKKAQAKANETQIEVTGNTIGKKILDYIFEPLEQTSQSAAAD